MLRAAAHAQRATTHAQSDDERSESDCARSERDGVVVAGSVEDLFLVFVRSEARRQTTSVLDDEQRGDDDDRQQHDSAQHPAHNRRHGTLCNRSEKLEARSVRESPRTVIVVIYRG